MRSEGKDLLSKPNYELQYPGVNITYPMEIITPP